MDLRDKKRERLLGSCARTKSTGIFDFCPASTDNYNRMPKLKLQTALGMLFLIAVLITIVSAVRKGAFVDHSLIRPELLRPPREYTTFEREFVFSYRGHDYKVKPLRNYELYGLVVSHNDINAISDIVHDDKSVDTRDVAVIWGDNLRSNDFQKVKYNNTATWVHWRCPRGVIFDPECISNNHLITDN